MEIPDTANKLTGQAMNQLRADFTPVIKQLNPEIEPITMYVLRPPAQEPAK